MPRRKGSRGGGVGGRPSGDYSKLTEEEKKDYHAQATRTSRGKEPQSQDSANDSQEPSTEQKSVGRPALGDTAMTPNTRKRRKREQSADRRHKESVSKARQKAVNVRWQIENTDSENPAETNEPSSTLSVSEEPSGSSSADSKSLSLRQIYRLRARLVGLLPSKPFENLDVFFHSLKLFPDCGIQSTKYKYISNLTRHQRLYCSKMIMNLISKYPEDTQINMLKYWLQRLLSDSIIERAMDKAEINIPPELIPKSMSVHRIQESLSSTFLSRCRSAEEQKRQGTLFIIAVAKQASLSVDNYGDIRTLAQATSCSWRFAKTVLQAIQDGTEDSLLTRNVRCDSIKATDWPKKIVEHVFQPENTRPVPGQETVSVRYGIRRPKYILLKARRNIAEEFKQKHPECPFSVSTIMREFPQNAITPTNRDLERNTCPVHANARRMIKCLHKAGMAKDISPSCRLMAAATMCQSESVDPSDPLTWNDKCVFGDCSDCPSLNMNTPPGAKNKQVSFSQWTYQLSADKGKNVFGLFLQNMTLEDASSKFVCMLPKLRQHIFIAHHQWQAHALARSKLDLSSLITVEDYQQNLEVIFAEAPTSMAYSTNKLTVAVYPICVEYMDRDLNLQKGAVVFITEDKRHDFQQVEAFERRMFEIVRTKCPGPIRNWQRYSDACAAQFRSRKVNAKLLSAKKEFSLDNVAFEYFEANEGKNISDTIGSIVKCAFQRGVTKENEGLTKASEIVRIICSELKEATAKFAFFIVEEFQPFERETENEEYPLSAIMSMHSLRLHKTGILAKKLTCTACSPNETCESCQKEPPTIMVAQQNGEEEQPAVQDVEDEGATDMSDSEDDSENEDLSPGEIVWAKYGRVWYPAKIVSSEDVPKKLQKSLFRTKPGEDVVVVKWYGEDRFSRVKAQNVEILAENKIDAARAAKNDKIHQYYQLAVSELRQD